MKKKHKIEIVKWKDALSIDPWTPASEVTPIFHEIVTVGMLIGEDEEVATFSLNYDTDGENYSCFIHIPKSMILSRKKLGSV